MDTLRYTNITQIKEANAAAGWYWFSTRTVKFFEPKVESRVYATARDTRLWVESTTNANGSAREYKVSEFFPETGKIEYLGFPERPVFTSAKLAQEHLLSNLDA